MRILSFFLLGGILLLGACQPEVEGEVDATATYDTVGAEVTPEGAVPVQAVVAEAGKYDQQNVKIEGVVSEVCQNAGCWLTLQADDAASIRIFVDKEEGGAYKFTFPTDISGRRVIVAGYLEAQTLDADTQRHLDEDDGLSQEEIAARTYTDKQELQLTATGALLQKTRI